MSGEIWASNVEVGDVIAVPTTPAGTILKTWHDCAWRQPGDIRTPRTVTGMEQGPGERICITVDDSLRLRLTTTSVVELLSQRPGCGPTDAVYQWGDRVILRWRGQPEIPGIVVSDHKRMSACLIQTPNHGTISQIAANMRPDPTPPPKVGQRWRQLSIGVCGVVTEAGDIRTTLRDDATGMLRRFIIAGPQWRQL